MPPHMPRRLLSRSEILHTRFKAEVPKSYLGTPVEVDGGIRAFVIPEKHLRDLRPTILDSAEAPGK